MCTCYSSWKQVLSSHSCPSIDCNCSRYALSISNKIQWFCLTCTSIYTYCVASDERMQLSETMAFSDSNDCSNLPYVDKFCHSSFKSGISWKIEKLWSKRHCLQSKCVWHCGLDLLHELYGEGFSSASSWLHSKFNTGNIPSPIILFLLSINS
jgi:hypothetical protein